ncbi:gonadotropin-releasing hormone II receptor-like [Asterias amurensis]|uniref:gonadotropin-releasing hormone II receptor-like n=1 Tax=Asterias amurensis TaxID=7602 RepID=UPI003AB20752
MATTSVNPTLITYIYETVEVNDTYSNFTKAGPTSDGKGTNYHSGISMYDDYLIRLILYVIIFVVSTIGNTAVLCSLIKGRRRKSRVNLLIMHLTVADLMITFFNIPTYFIWLITYQWYGGDIMCRSVMYIAMVGTYASPFILIVISLDRFASIVFPLSVRQADMRCKIMLRVAWAACIIASIPQLLIHQVMSPKSDPDFTQCVDYGFRENFPVVWNLYHWFVMAATYFIPLTLIIGCYTSIVVKIFGNSTIRSYSGNNGNRMTLRRSGVDTLPKARVRALKMTGAIVTAFIVCWTPTCIEGTITHANPALGEATPLWLNHIMLAFGFSNVCIDPIVYGMFTVDFRRHFPGCFDCWGGRRGRRSGRSTTSSNNYPPVTYASSTRCGTTTGVSGNYHVMELDSRHGTAEKCV